MKFFKIDKFISVVSCFKTFFSLFFTIIAFTNSVRKIEFRIYIYNFTTKNQRKSFYIMKLIYISRNLMKIAPFKSPDSWLQNGLDLAKPISK